MQDPRRLRVRLPVRFVGSGSEYFRIWIVNLLLTLLTLGLYYPWAKLRRLRYFHGATEVGGHALAFHGDARRMLRGYLLVALLVGAYSFAGQVSALAGALAALLVGLLWPALWHVSLKFRLANTSWRGLRLAFTGSRAGAYAAMLLLALGVAISVGLSLWAGAAAGDGNTALLGLLALLPLLLSLALPALFWSIKRYQQGHYRLAGERSRFRVPLRAAYGLALRSVGVSLLFALLLGAVFGALFVLLGALARSGVGGGSGGAWMPGPVLSQALGTLLVVVLLQVSGVAWLQARLQNLIWNGTGSAHLRFESRLRFRSLALVTARNWLLMALTLGLYFPFARVASARVRLQAVTVVMNIEPDTLLQAERSRSDDASGDAAADLLGVDLGL